MNMTLESHIGGRRRVVGREENRQEIAM